jgi:hypothetical protein
MANPHQSRMSRVPAAAKRSRIDPDNAAALLAREE